MNGNLDALGVFMITSSLMGIIAGVVMMHVINKYEAELAQVNTQLEQCREGGK